MAGPNSSGVSQAISVVGGLDALIRGSSSPFAQMTSEMIRVSCGEGGREGRFFKGVCVELNSL